MINPFQLAFRNQQKHSYQLFRSTRWMIILGAGATLAFLLTLFWFIKQADWLPPPLKGMLAPPLSNNQVFVAKADLSREQARALYRQAIASLEGGNYEKALSELKQLEGVYPGLSDLLWLHEAEAYAGQGNEWAVQKKLNHLLEQHVGSPLKAIALYRIGQSQYRGSEWQQAQKTFEKIRKQDRDSQYATGSLYYLGAILARMEGKKLQALPPLKEYLRLCSDCKFSGDTAELLEKLLPQVTKEEHGLIGLAYAATARDNKRTLFHLSQGPRVETWLALGKTQIRANQEQLGVQTLMNGLPYAKDTEMVRTAVDTILAHTPGARHANTLKTLSNLKLPIGGDYILWKLAEAEPGQSKTHYQMLVKTYPKGDYAPESSWRLLWPLVSSGNSAAYLSQAQQFLKQYPYARSAPRALFWSAKLLEKSKPTDATSAYQRLLKQYPTNYYAFRAKGRLNVLAGGKSDPGWPTFSSRSDYPIQNTDFSTLDILPPASEFAAGELGWILRNQAKELQAIGAGEDLKLLVSESLGTLPPAVESWAYQMAGDRAKGLRVIRDFLEQSAKEAFTSHQTAEASKAGKKDELKLLYPVYFAEKISQFAQRNRLDPFLVQSLMREESYFNEFAISTSNARGLMQLLPSTAQEVANWESLSSFQTGDLFLPEINIRLGSRYLAHLHDIFKSNSMPAVGAYNGGPNAMRRWVQGSPHLASDPDMFVEQIPYEQSRDYIKKVFGSYWNYTRLYSHSPI